MEVQKILKELDALYAAGDREKTETFLTETVRKAEEEDDWQTQIVLNNEMMGLYRELGQIRDAVRIFGRTKAIFDEKNMIGTVPYASTLQNAANAYRVGGFPAEAIKLFEEALEIYKAYLDDGDFRIAGLYNNLSLLYLEQGAAWKAKEYSEEALKIIEKLAGTEIEQATNHVNLANLYCQTGDLANAKKHLDDAAALFATEENEDPHYSSLLSAWGQVYIAEEKYAEAERSFRDARAEVSRYFGKNRAYASITKNLALALERQGKLAEAKEQMELAEQVLKDLNA